jgi:tyrosyl-tRNA synthetase
MKNTDMTLSEELTWRGFVNQTTYKDSRALDTAKVSFYFGVDPSADSMTIGNLAAAMMVKCFIKHGHHPFLLVGGATGMIGDPDGKSQERELLTIEQLTHNKTRIAAQYQQIFGEYQFELVDNYDWFEPMGYLEFLRDIGKHVPMRQMLGRDFVQARLTEQGGGISYAEFSYVLIQAYDFLHLYKNNGVTLQLCGSDQWGNSIAGVELIRRLEGGEAHVYSSPLIVNKATGVKFGKTETGAIWLDPAKTSPFQFYQFWLNADDDGVEEYLKMFTELDPAIVADIMDQFLPDRASRVAQRRLAYEVTTLVHGQREAAAQAKVADALAAQNVSQLDEAGVMILSQEIPHLRIPDAGHSIVEVLVQTDLAVSNSDARRLLAAGSVTLSGRKVTRENFEPQDFIEGRIMLRRGKALKDSALIELG